MTKLQTPPAAEPVASSKQVPRSGLTLFVLLLWMGSSLCLWFCFFEPLSAQKYPLKAGMECPDDIYSSITFEYADSSDVKTTIHPETLLIKQGATLTEADERLLNTYDQRVQEEKERAFSIQRFVHGVIQIGLMLICFGFCVYKLRPTFFSHTRRVLLCVVLSLLHFLLIAACRFYLDYNRDGSSIHLLTLMPLALVPMLTSHLLGVRVSISHALFLTTLTPLLLEGEFQCVLFQYSVLFSILGIGMFHNVRRRGGVIWRSILLFVVYICVAMFVLWYREQSQAYNNQTGPFDKLLDALKKIDIFKLESWKSALSSIPWYWLKTIEFAAINAAACAIGMLLLPQILERFFDVISLFSLQSKKERIKNDEDPLINEMKEKAGGTYTHSMNVASMAEAGAKAIGVNSLLAYVAGCYHDIGKLMAPSIFVENWAVQANEDFAACSPFEKARQIRKHVIDGEKLAKKHHLPYAIREAIRSHHGNDTIGTFYKDALEQASARYAEAIVEAQEKKLPLPDEKAFLPDEKDFCYDAPLPHTKEGVIVELSDIAEAAGRAVCKKKKFDSPQEVTHFVTNLIMTKMQHGQFADTAMTLSELTRATDAISRELYKISLSWFSTRPDYNTTPSSDNDKPEDSSNKETMDSAIRTSTELSR